MSKIMHSSTSLCDWRSCWLTFWAPAAEPECWNCSRRLPLSAAAPWQACSHGGCPATQRLRCKVERTTSTRAGCGAGVNCTLV
jgi:hypothetical protein